MPPPPPKEWYGMEGEWEGMQKKESKATNPTDKENKTKKKQHMEKKGNAMEEGNTKMSVGDLCNETQKTLRTKSMHLQHVPLCGRQESSTLRKWGERTR